ncbi:MAG: DNA-3-methyladenine glycosylase 2 family protein [Candidatus Neomarinimicrobiota bacterium]|nr:DNA-3-methyladenine glycosylase 2 family protein [Candidatus Neomarinimicrobiota bacterium]
MSSLFLNDRTIVDGINQLSSIDPILKHLFNGFDIPKLKIEKNYFWSLCRSIIYQQISGKAAKTISDRFLALFRSGINIQPREVLDIDINSLYSIGLSRQKASYMKNIAEAFGNKLINDEFFLMMNDEEILKQLTIIKGVGKWTAEMFLIFPLRRSDVFPVTDLGVQKGFQIVYDLDELSTIEQMNEKAEEWKPYRTIVTLYLWYAVDGPFEW